MQWQLREYIATISIIITLMQWCSIIIIMIIINSNIIITINHHHHQLQYHHQHHQSEEMEHDTFSIGAPAGRLSDDHRGNGRIPDDSSHQ